MIRMKSLCSFGVPGSNEGKVRRGREFMVASEHRARDLEQRGLAFRVAYMPPEESKAPVAAVPNPAAVAGPLPSAGGETGAENVPSSSDQDPQPRFRRSRRQKAELDL